MASFSIPVARETNPAFVVAIPLRGSLQPPNPTNVDNTLAGTDDLGVFYLFYDKNGKSAKVEFREDGILFFLNNLIINDLEEDGIRNQRLILQNLIELLTKPDTFNDLDKTVYLTKLNSLLVMHITENGNIDGTLSGNWSENSIEFTNDLIRFERNYVCHLIEIGDHNQLVCKTSLDYYKGYCEISDSADKQRMLRIFLDLLNQEPLHKDLVEMSSKHKERFFDIIRVNLTE